MSWAWQDYPHSKPQPADLVTLREASERSQSETGGPLSVATIRNWIYAGVAGAKIPTHRQPGNPHRVLISYADVCAFRDRSANMFRYAPKQRGKGRASLEVSVEDRETLHSLSALLTKRLGVRLSLTDTVRLALQSALHAEVMRQSAAKEE